MKQRIKWLIRPAADFGPKHYKGSSNDEDCNEECYRQIKNLRSNNRKAKKDVCSLSDKHIDSQVPLASNFDDEEEDDEMEIDDFYNNNITNEQTKRNLSKQYSIDFRSDNMPLKNHYLKDNNLNDLNSDKKSKKCMYSRQNMNFINDDLLNENDGLHMKLSLNSDQTEQPTQFNKSGLNSDILLINQKSKFNETNF